MISVYMGARGCEYVTALHISRHMLDEGCVGAVSNFPLYVGELRQCAVF